MRFKPILLVAYGFRFISNPNLGIFFLMKNKINRAFLFVFLLLVAAPVFAQNLTVAGLKENVTVRRDGRGIPYIEAKTDADLYFAQGYVTAQ